MAAQVGLLAIGITRPYALKHEDNNALHATFARSHLALGAEVTHAQNYFYNPHRAEGAVYANHPPAPGLVLAMVYRVAGADGPAVTRATAIAFHLVATWLFYGLARRVLAGPGEVLLATAVFAGVAQSTFFGRMLNHEVLVLPGALLMVRGYWERRGGDWPPTRAWAALVGGAVWAGLSGWVGFLAIGACGLVALIDGVTRRGRGGIGVFATLAATGLTLFAAVVGQLLWVLDGNGGYLVDLLASRAGADQRYGVGPWVFRVFELHWRYFSLTSLCGLVAVGARAVAGVRRGAAPDPAVTVASIFLAAGLASVVLFNERSVRHDYWQFLLLPASALGVTLVYRWLASRIATARHRATWIALLGVVTFEVVSVPLYTLDVRHRRTEAYCLEVVAAFERDFL